MKPQPKTIGMSDRRAMTRAEALLIPQPECIGTVECDNNHRYAVHFNEFCPVISATCPECGTYQNHFRGHCFEFFYPEPRP